MKTETLNHLNQVNGVGEEPNIGERHTNNDRKKVWSRYRNWLIGLAISIIPLIAVPSMKLFKGESGLCQMLYETFCSYEIIFVGISLAIASLNDFIARESKEDKGGWTLVNVVLIILGAMIYGGLAIENASGQSFDFRNLFTFNMIYLGMIFVLGTAKYLQEFWEVG